MFSDSHISIPVRPNEQRLTSDNKADAVLLRKMHHAGQRGRVATVSAFCEIQRDFSGCNLLNQHWVNFSGKTWFDSTRRFYKKALKSRH